MVISSLIERQSVVRSTIGVLVIIHLFFNLFRLFIFAKNKIVESNLHSIYWAVS